MTRHRLPDDAPGGILRQVHSVIDAHQSCHAAGRFFRISIPLNGDARRAHHGCVPRRPCPRARPGATSPGARRRPADLVVRRVRVLHFEPRRKVDHVGGDPHRRRNRPRQVVERARHVSPDVEDLVARGGHVDRLRHERRHVGDVAERTRLRAVAEDRHRLALQDLVHEDADDVAIPVADVLARAVDVVRAEDDVVEPEHLPARVAAPARRRTWRCRTSPPGAAAPPPVNGSSGLAPYTAIEDVKTNDSTPVIDRRVDQVDAADDVVRVVEALDEVAQAFRGVGGEVIDVREADAREQAIDGVGIRDAAVHEAGGCRDVLAEPAAEIVEDVHLVSTSNERVGYVRPDKPRPTRHEVLGPSGLGPPGVHAVRITLH